MIEADAERIKTFHDRRARLESARHASFQEQDRSILTLSSAGLGLSLTIARDLVSKQAPHVSWLLTGSWIAFGLAIGATLISFRTSIAATNAWMENEEQYYLHQREDYLNRPVAAARATDLLNLLALACFLLAIVFTIVFAACNYQRGTP